MKLTPGLLTLLRIIPLFFKNIYFFNTLIINDYAYVKRNETTFSFVLHRLLFHYKRPNLSLGYL